MIPHTPEQPEQQFEELERLELFHRLGPLNLLNAEHPDRWYRLELERHEDREVCRLLIALRNVDAGEPWQDYKYRPSEMQPWLPDWQLPAAWCVDEGRGPARRSSDASPDEGGEAAGERAHEHAPDGCGHASDFPNGVADFPDGMDACRTKYADYTVRRATSSHDRKWSPAPAVRTDPHRMLASCVRAVVLRGDLQPRPLW